MTKKTMGPLCAALLLGCLFPLGFAPFNWWWCSLIAVGCFPLILGQAQGFLRGWAFGTGVFTVGVSWVYVSLSLYTGAGPIGASIATLLLGLALGLFFALLGYVHQKVPETIRHPIISVGLWVVFEWIRSWLLTGFPWLYLGYTALDAPIAQHWIPVIGVYGCSMLLGLWATLLIHHGKTIFETRTVQPRYWVSFVFLLALPLSNLWLGNIQWTQKTGQSISLALMQGNIDQANKWDPQHARPISEQYLKMTELALEDGAELVIWPEAAVPYLYSEGIDVIERGRDLLAGTDHQPELITGILTDDQPDQSPSLSTTTTFEPYWPEVRNSILTINQDKSADQLYHKQRLVPFGEYLPFADQLIQVFPFLSAFKHGITAGNREQPPIQSRNWLIQPLLCYEIAFPSLAYSQINRSTEPGKTVLVDAILTISNDGWFGLSHGPAQHYQMARFRAKEFGRPVIRGTNTGITGVINAQGDSVALLPRQTEATLFHTLQQVSGTTPYSMIGPITILVLVFLATLAKIGIRTLRQMKISPEKQ